MPHVRGGGAAPAAAGGGQGVRIGLISSRYPPESSPGAKRASDLVGSLRGAGHQAVVMTQQPNYPDPSAFETCDERMTLERDGSDGTTTMRFRPRLAPKARLVSRLISEARFAWLTSRPSTGVGDLDGLVASTPFIFNLAAARTYRRPMWLDVRDLTWEYVHRFGATGRLKRAGASMLRSLSFSNLRAAVRVSTTTRRQRGYLIDGGLPADKVIVVPNGVARRVVDELLRRGRTRDEAGSNGGSGGPLRIVYAGLLGFPQGLSFLVESFGDLAPRDAELHLYGDGVDRSKLTAYCAQRGLRSVELHGHVDHDAYLDALVDADVLVASLRPGAEAAMPSKIWEYMAAGKPILFCGRGEAAEAIEDARAGLCVDYGDRSELQAKLGELLASEERRRELGANGRRWVLERQVREDINREWVREIEQAFGGGR